MKAHEYGNPLARTVLIQPVDEQDLSLIENEVEEIARLSVVMRHGERDYRPCHERGFIGQGLELAPLTENGEEQAEKPLELLNGNKTTFPRTLIE